MNNKSKRVEARMSGELYKRLKQAAKDRGVSVSQIISLSVGRFLNKK